jgi:glyoxylase-like metal-dependent hydrolase (beta-lactamase superfamily II)
VEVTSKVYQITHRGVNIILIAEEELTLIDTGFRGSSSRIIKFIHSLGRSAGEISLIIITHNHLDHAGGLAELKKLTAAKVAAHIADISDDEAQLPYRKTVRKLLRIPPFSILRPLLYARSDEVDIQLKGDEELSPLGGLKVIHTPGHTPGSISLFSPRKKLLIVGDALNNRHRDLRFPPKFVSTNLAQAIDSVKRMAQLDFDIICFGHGKPIIGDAVTRVRDLINKHEI